MRDWMEIAKEGLEARSGYEAARDLLRSTIFFVSGEKSADGRLLRVTFLTNAKRFVFMEFRDGELSLESCALSDLSRKDRTDSCEMISLFSADDAHSSDNNEEVRLLYHNLWTRDVHTDGYDKDKWIRLGYILGNAGYKL